jgi:hypothetical protein
MGVALKSTISAVTPHSTVEFTGVLEEHTPSLWDQRGSQTRNEQNTYFCVIGISVHN